MQLLIKLIKSTSKQPNTKTKPHNSQYNKPWPESQYSKILKLLEVKVPQRIILILLGIRPRVHLATVPLLLQTLALVRRPQLPPALLPRLHIPRLSYAIVQHLHPLHIDLAHPPLVDLLTIQRKLQTVRPFHHPKIDEPLPPLPIILQNLALLVHHQNVARLAFGMRIEIDVPARIEHTPRTFRVLVSAIHPPQILQPHRLQLGLHTRLVQQRGHLAYLLDRLLSSIPKLQQLHHHPIIPALRYIHYSQRPPLHPHQLALQPQPQLPPFSAIVLIVGFEVEARLVRMRILRRLPQILQLGVEGYPRTVSHAVVLRTLATERMHFIQTGLGFDCLHRMPHIGDAHDRSLLDDPHHQFFSRQKLVEFASIDARLEVAFDQRQQRRQVLVLSTAHQPIQYICRTTYTTTQSVFSGISWPFYA